MKKINVTFDLTLEEFRQTVGLPMCKEFRQVFQTDAGKNTKRRRGWPEQHGAVPNYAARRYEQPPTSFKMVFSCSRVKDKSSRAFAKMRLYHLSMKQDEQNRRQ